MKLLERTLTIIAPHRCLICGYEGQILCPWCAADACPALPDRCYRCHALTMDSKVCSACHRRSPLKHVWVRTEYDGVAKKLIHALKFQRATAAALPIAELIAEALPFLPSETIICHVPTATTRYRQRGYDQAQLIARHVARIKNVHYAPLLARHGQTRQVGARREQRLHQLADAFRPRNTHLITGGSIVLVDDIVTTGATLEAAAKVLKIAGAKRISAAVFAQKM